MADYPIPAFHFQVSWGGAKLAFTEASGLKVETDIIEYRDGLSPDFSKTKMPGQRKFSDITLKRGVFKSDNQFYEWWNTISLNKVERRDIVISLLDENHKSGVVWKVKNAWPSSLEGPSLNATGNEVAIESMTIVNEGIAIENA
jgi:phage tail-like protein